MHVRGHRLRPLGSWLSPVRHSTGDWHWRHVLPSLVLSTTPPLLSDWLGFTPPPPHSASRHRGTVVSEVPSTKDLSGIPLTGRPGGWTPGRKDCYRSPGFNPDVRVGTRQSTAPSMWAGEGLPGGRGVCPGRRGPEWAPLRVCVG